MKKKVERDLVFERLCEGCPHKQKTEKKCICLLNKKVCSPRNCGPYHWYKG